MCIAIYKPKGVDLPLSIFANCWQIHPDGAGFMYPKQGKVTVFKEAHDFQKFKPKLLAHLEGPARKQNVVIHFRTATAGQINFANTHPFQVNEQLAFVHNGSMPFENECSDVDSDTKVFCEKYLQHPDFKLTTQSLRTIEKYINPSKMIFMDGDGRVSILNEHLGVWEHDCWFSNESWRR